MKVGVVGLGYVGATLLSVLADTHHELVGIDTNSDRLALAHIAELSFSRPIQTGFDYRLLADADVVLVAVETPTMFRQPNYGPLTRACHQLGTVLASGTLVIIESTVGPETCEKIVKPALENGGRKFRLGHCPERLTPGRLVYNVKNMSRVCGGDVPETSQAMIDFYKTFVDGPLYPADLITAELVKTLENSFRDVQIAFSNEAAQICQIFGADVWTVRELVNTAPGRAMLEPGPGVGGACIPKDPWLLIQSTGRHWDVMIAARHANDAMPGVVADWIGRRLYPPSRIGILGQAYRENTEDVRQSPATALGSALIDKGFTVVYYDPVVFPDSPINRLAGADALILATKHEAFMELPWDWLRENVKQRLFFDTRNYLAAQARAAGFEVHVLGRRTG